MLRAGIVGLFALTAASGADPGSVFAPALEPNRGQAPDEVRYLGRGAKFEVSLFGDRLEFRQGSAAATMRWIGGRAPDSISGERKLPGPVHYPERGSSEIAARDSPVRRRAVPEHL